MPATRSAGMSGPALAVAAGGAFLVYVGIKGTNPMAELRGILSGQAPEPLSRSTKFKGLGTGDFGGGTIPGTASSSSALLNAAQKYAGKPYRWRATGPDAFDCSGLVWRAGRDIGIPWARFTTATVAFSRWVQKVSVPAAGDLVVWPGDHMGIFVGGDRMFAATHTGDVVRFQEISGRRRKPMYLRVLGPAAREKLDERSGRRAA